MIHKLGIPKPGPLLIAAAAAFSLSTLFSAMKPILLTRFVEQLGLNEALAGLLVAMPFVGLACAALCARWLMHRYAYRTLLWWFSGVLISSELICALAYTSATLVLIAQLIAGISVGVLMGLMSRLITRQVAADQLFGFADMIAVLLMSLMIAAVGEAVAWAGLQGGYLAAASIAGLLTLIMLAAPLAQTDLTTATLGHAIKLDINVRSVATVLMGVLFVTSSGLGFAFMFTLAQNLQMDYAVAARQIGGLLFVSAFACWVGGWCSGRFGPHRPLACAFFACGAGWYVAIHTASPLIFMLALVPAVFALQFCFPIFLAISAALDRTGQWAAVATPLLTSGFAWAAISAGFIVERFGLEALASATVTGMLLCAALLPFTRAPSAAALAANAK